jgi:serine/threonine-protein kinase
MSIASGTAIGSILVERPIADDSRGELYLGRQPALDRTVVLKRLPGEPREGGSGLEAFLREARLGGRLIHPNVVQVLDCFAHGGDRYLVLEHVDGLDLGRVLDSGIALPPRVAGRIAREVCRALQAAHVRRVVHCDLRPEHVLVSRWGEVKLTGFGCARELGESGPAPEPSACTAPELARGEPPGWPTDVYALGVILFEMLTGAAKDDPWARPADRRLSRLAARCTNPEPELRPSLREVAARLDRRIGDPPSPDTQAEIAAWLWEARIFRPQTETEEAPVGQGGLVGRPAARSGWSLAKLRIRELAPVALGGAAAAAAALLLVGWLQSLAGWVWGPDSTPPGPEETRLEIPSVSAEGPVAAAGTQERGLVAFVAYPWAEVEVDGRSFLTPRVAPVAVAPGEHEVVFRHPTFGVARHRVRVNAGQTALVRHKFAGSERSQ